MSAKETIAELKKEFTPARFNNLDPKSAKFVAKTQYVWHLQDAIYDTKSELSRLACKHIDLLGLLQDTSDIKAQQGQLERDLKQLVRELRRVTA